MLYSLPCTGDVIVLKEVADREKHNLQRAGGRAGEKSDNELVEQTLLEDTVYGDTVFTSQQCKHSWQVNRRSAAATAASVPETEYDGGEVHGENAQKTDVQCIV